MSLAERVRPLLAALAPPSSVRRRVLRLGYRTIRSLRELLSQRRLARAVGAIPQNPEAAAATIRPAGAQRIGPREVLVIDHRLPTPDRDSGSVRMMELIRAIARRGHPVTFIPNNEAVFSPYLEDLERAGVEVVYPPHYQSTEEFLSKYGHEYRLAIVARADVAERHIDTVRRHAPQAKIVFDTVDLCFLREERQAQIAADASLQATASLRKEQELRLARSADMTLVVSAIEKAVLEAECGPDVDVRILSNIHRVATSKPPGYLERRDILFIGGFDHQPNVDAVLFFAHEVFPLVRKRLPGVVFQVVGPYPTPAISALASESIHVLGFVPDVKPIFDKARLSVAPLRFGAGVKGKVNQSMSLGVPTVVTSIAAEGMHLTHEFDTMIADRPERFADAVVQLWSSPELWRKIARNGLCSLQKHFSLEAAARPIDEILAWAGLSATGKIEEERGHERARPRSRVESGSGSGSSTATVAS
jgi:glycosyltransferase involved in cell wall biosynthesis